MPKKLIDGFDSIEKVIGALLVLVLFFVLLYQTFARSLGLSATWTDEMARYLFALLVYVGAGLAMLLDKHIKIDILVYIWPKRIRPFIETMGSLISALFCAYVFCHTLRYDLFVVMASGRVSPTISIPMWIPHFSVVIGYLLMLVRLIQVELFPRLREILRRNDEETVADDEISERGGPEL